MIDMLLRASSSAIFTMLVDVQVPPGSHGNRKASLGNVARGLRKSIAIGPNVSPQQAKSAAASEDLLTGCYISRTL